MSQHLRHVRKTTVVKNPDGDRLKIGGYKPDRKQTQGKKYGIDHDRINDLPPKVDLRPYMTPVENQGDTNSCTANAMAGAYEYLANRLLGHAGDVSRLFIYYNARALDDAIEQDEGTYLQSCVEVLQQYGTCSESTWPFDADNIFNEPDETAYTEAAGFLIEEAQRVDVDLDAMRACLADGYPFAFGLQLFTSFQKAGSKGLVPMPDQHREQHDGGHAMLCVGYSDPDRVFIVRNSWGEQWGDRGYCYIPYDYMADSELNHDCWTVRRVSDHVDLSQDIQGDDSSLFGGAISAIVQMIQTPGTSNALDDDGYEVTYEEQLVYTDDRGFIPIEEYQDLNNFYDQDSVEEEEESDEEEEIEDESDNEEEDEESYEEEDSDEEEDYEEESDEGEEIEDEYDNEEEDSDEEEEEEEEGEEEEEEEEGEEDEEEEEGEEDEEEEEGEEDEEEYEEEEEEEEGEEDEEI